MWFAAYCLFLGLIMHLVYTQWVVWRTLRFLNTPRRGVWYLDALWNWDDWLRRITYPDSVVPNANKLDWARIVGGLWMAMYIVLASCGAVLNTTGSKMYELFIFSYPVYYCVTIIWHKAAKNLSVWRARRNYLRSLPHE